MADNLNSTAANLVEILSDTSDSVQKVHASGLAKFAQKAKEAAKVVKG